MTKLFMNHRSHNNWVVPESQPTFALRPKETPNLGALLWYMWFKPNGFTQTQMDSWTSKLPGTGFTSGQLWGPPPQENLSSSELLTDQNHMYANWNWFLGNPYCVCVYIYMYIYIYMHIEMYTDLCVEDFRLVNIYLTWREASFFKFYLERSG